MKYSGSDFKFTSQANHLQKLLALKAENHREDMHAQRLYKRRKFCRDGRVKSNWRTLNKSALPEQQQIAEATDSGINTLTQINIYTDDYYGEESYWEPIGGGEH